MGGELLKWASQNTTTPFVESICSICHGREKITVSVPMRSGQTRALCIHCCLAGSGIWVHSRRSWMWLLFCSYLLISGFHLAYFLWLFCCCYVALLQSSWGYSVTFLWLFLDSYVFVTWLLFGCCLAFFGCCYLFRCFVFGFSFLLRWFLLIEFARVVSPAWLVFRVSFGSSLARGFGSCDALMLPICPLVWLSIGFLLLN